MNCHIHHFVKPESESSDYVQDITSCVQLPSLTRREEHVLYRVIILKRAQADAKM